ncbi:hypothetical protein HPB49_016274 [Dermacentor silvarum]|uniref:Uncharacterized protein n=1 Tax=Dermacentor silvarum TaxID=543639 RepID=A0ACB8CSD9_DERSI|nr:hypothetical protein HPB49_016274 [Dermacentor silvarum]
MAAPSRAIIVQPATSCVPSTTPGGEELMDVASAAVSVTDESKRQARTQRALPTSAAAMQEARRQNAREEIHDTKRRRMESEQLEDDADIRKAASLQAEWSSHEPEEGFEGDGLWERATTRSRRKAAQREQGNSTRPTRVVERTELGCFVLAIRPRERRSIVSLNAREVEDLHRLPQPLRPLTKPPCPRRSAVERQTIPKPTQPGVSTTMSFINWRVATAEDLATLNAQLIKTELQRRNLSTTGNKEELIDRLLVDTAKDPPPNHEPVPCVPEISTSFSTMPLPTTSFPAMPVFPSDPAENMQRMAAFLHQNMAIMMTTIASHANPVHVTTLPDLSASLPTFNRSGTPIFKH